MPWLLASLWLRASGALAQERPALEPRMEGGRVRYEAARATVYFDSGDFTPEQMARFARLVDKGIADIESYLNDGPESVRPDAPRITYHVSANIPMSRTYRRTVELPAERVKTDSAPYLHETTHVLMRVRSRSMWLSEGFASFVQSYVAEHKGGYDGVVFSWGGNGNVDRLARRYLSRDSGKTVLPFVGGAGSPPEVWEERRQVAAPFYVLSHSFVKYLVDNGGLATVKELIQADDISGALERATKRSLDRWKADWLASLEARAEPIVHDVEQASATLSRHQNYPFPTPQPIP